MFLYVHRADDSTGFEHSVIKTGTVETSLKRISLEIKIRSSSEIIISTLSCAEELFQALIMTEFRQASLPPNLRIV